MTNVGPDRGMNGQTARILIVEDEEPLTLLLRYNLESEGYQVDAVARGDEADTRLKESVPDLIVLDWMLPGLSGIELCRRLRTRPETKSLPIIMLTARGEESERVRGLVDRRRRLHRQAVLGAGIAGARARAAAARQARAHGGHPQARRARTRSRQEARAAQRPRHRAWTHRI